MNAIVLPVPEASYVAIALHISLPGCLQKKLEGIDAVCAKRLSWRRLAIAIPDIHLLPELRHPTRLAIAWREAIGRYERQRCGLQQIALQHSAK
jgi:hypothetical protein